MSQKFGISMLCQRFLLTLLGMVFFTSFAYAELREVTPQKLQESVSKGVPIIDIRRADEWKDTGIIESSNTLTFFDDKGKYDLKDWMSKFVKIVKDKNQPFILVCRSGNRSGVVGTFLNEKFEYKNVYHLKGGMNAWLSQERETVK